MDAKHTLLREVFGWPEFREGQEALVDAALSGRDVFGVMPTGGGKSLCYQLPAMLLPGVTVVISPLISLMKDQVMALEALGVPAGYINSSLSSEEAREVYAGLHRGAYKLIYAAPERLLNDGFLSALWDAEVSMVAVDEAHCISQWGQDFRPSYLKIPDFLAKLSRRPVLGAYTATATPAVREDVERLLGLRDPLRVVTGFDRPNLRFEVQAPVRKYEALLRLLRREGDRSGIIYCSTRKEVERLCQRLRDQGVNATRYHAGLEDEERKRNQEDFLYDRRTVMVATNAFGMGIDKSNVGYVIHYNMPKSLEAYYQEAGRAGRDGAPADCVLLFSRADVHTARFLVETTSENTELSYDERVAVMAQDYERLDRMIGYCETGGCLRAYILDYFGQVHPDRCSNCGNCAPLPGAAKAGTVTVERDVTREAQMVLSCVQRIRDRLGYHVGQTLVIQTLRGSRSARVLELGLDELSTYGLLKSKDNAYLGRLMNELIDRGLLRVDRQYSTVLPTPAARAVLFQGERVTMRVPEERPPEPKRRKARAQPVPEEPFEPRDPDNELLEALKALRARFAREEGVPLYVIFSNATLLEMVRLRPRTTEELLWVSGVGTVKAQRFGEAFLEEIRKFD